MSELRAYGGYISNAVELAGRLNIDPKAYPGSSEELDKAVVKAAYDLWGKEFVKQIYGNFFIIIDDGEKTICARDRFGNRSLYYYITEEGRLLCGTSIREIIKMPGFVKSFNEDALELFLSFSYMPGEDTFFEGLKKLMPGKLLIWDGKKLEIETYWEAKVNQNKNISLEEMGNEIHKALLEAAKDWQRGAKVKGNFLSGGVDSGYLTALMQPQVTVSASYDNPAFDEAPMAAETAKAIGVEFGSFKIQPKTYFDAVPKAMEALEEPIGDASTIVFYLCAQEAAKKGDVFYSGEGADELFCGYHAYVRRLKQIEEAKEKGQDLSTLPQVENYFIGNTRVFHEDGKQAVLKNYRGNILPIDLARSMYKITEDMDDVTKILLCDLNVWFEGDIMLNAEKMSLAHQLDCRTPFLDQRVAEVALTIPSEFRANTEQTKLAFRTAATHLLPEDIAWRKKIGFAAPTRSWMYEEPYMGQIKAKLTGETAEKFFNTKLLMEMYEAEKIDENWRKLWCIYVFIVWYDIYFA